MVDAHTDLATALLKKDFLDKGIAACQEALRIKPDSAEAHNTLDIAFGRKGQTDEAIRAFREALRLKPDWAEADVNLGIVLDRKGLIDEAIGAFREAIRLKPHLPEAFDNLGIALQRKGALDEAIAAYKQAIHLKPDNATSYYNLGDVLQNKGALDEAIAAYKQAIQLNSDYAEAYCNLGHTLNQKGDFREALTAFRRGHELGSTKRGWPYPSARWIHDCERFVDLDSKLPAILHGEKAPASPAEQVEFGRLCALKKMNAAGARFFEEAFAAQPELAGDLGGSNRYDAACCAALAGSGKGVDVETLTEEERASWRRKALEWLQADLAYWANQAKSKSPQKHQSVCSTLTHWQSDPDLSGVRGNAALASLPASEREAWRKLWTDVESTLATARSLAVPGGMNQSGQTIIRNREPVNR